MLLNTYLIAFLKQKKLQFVINQKKSSSRSRHYVLGAQNKVIHMQNKSLTVYFLILIDALPNKTTFYRYLWNYH